jgi:predicted ATPase
VNTDLAHLMYAAAVKLCGPGEYSSYLYLFHSILPSFQVPDIELSLARESLNATQKNLRISQVITRIIQTIAAKQPVLLILEDIQWADTNSLSLLTSIVKKVKNLFIFCTMRPMLAGQSPISDEIDRLSSLEDSHRSTLSPLTSADCQSVAQKYFAISDIPQSILDLLTAAQGNPLYCIQLLTHLRTSQYVSITDNKLVITKDLSMLFKHFYFKLIVI